MRTVMLKEHRCSLQQTSAPAKVGQRCSLGPDLGISCHMWPACNLNHDEGSNSLQLYVIADTFDPLYTAQAIGTST